MKFLRLKKKNKISNHDPLLHFTKSQFWPQDHIRNNPLKNYRHWDQECSGR